MQRTAWDAYLALTRGLLPVLDDDDVDAAALKAELGRFGLRVVRYAPLWREHGPMLLGALCCALDLYGAGDRAELTDLLRVIANRLFILSAGDTAHELPVPPLGRPPEPGS